MKFNKFSELNSAKEIYESLKNDSIAMFVEEDFLGQRTDTFAEFYLHSFHTGKWELIKTHRIEVYQGDENLHYSSIFKNDSLITQWYYPSGVLKKKEIHFCDGNRLDCFLIFSGQYFKNGTPYVELNPLLEK